MARLFDTQSTDVINVGSLSQFDDEVDLTWTMHIKPDVTDPTSEDYLMGKANASGDGKRLSVEMSGQNYRMNFDVDTSASKVYARSDEFVQGAWNFLAVTWTGVGNVPRLFRGAPNGVVAELTPVQSSAGSGTIESEAEADLGIGNKIPTSSLRSFYGAMADVRWFDTAIPDEEFLTTIMYGRYARGDQLIGWWPIIGASPEPDWSGEAGGANAPGTIAGTPVVTDGPPSGPFFAADEYPAYIAAVAAARRVIII